MTAVHEVLGVALIAVNSAAALWGLWHWYRARASPAFWALARTGQGLVVVQAALGLVLLATGHHPAANLHVLYGALPLAVSFLAEQLRIGAAEAVLDDRDLASAQEVGRLPEGEQRAVVLAIVRREMGVMTVAALVVVALALRAASTAGGL